MNAFLRLLALAAAFLASPEALAQAVRMTPTANYGALVSPGGTTVRATFSVVDGQNRIRTDAIVRFDQHCTYLQRGEQLPYACVSAAPGEPLEVSPNGSGLVSSPVYQANGTVGNAWLNATLLLDGQVVTVPFFFRVGTAPIPMSFIAGNNQRVQVNQPLDEPLAVRVMDDRGRWLLGVPVTFASFCATSSAPGAPDNLPCVRLSPAAASTDGSGLVRVPGTANAIAGSYRVQASFAGGPFVELLFDLTNYTPVRLLVEPRKLQGLRIVDAPATCSIDLFEVEQVAPTGKPRMLAIPHGVVRVKIGSCPAGATLKLQFLHPGGMPEGSKVWSAGPTWRSIDTNFPVDGAADFTLVEGGVGDIDATANGRIEALLVMGFGDSDAPNFQDLWWTGISGNGWGISIVQHGQVLFPVFFVYDAAGEPTWYVMPAGSWNAARDTYSGNLYSPRGRPISAHRAQDLVAGAPAGRASLLFRDALTMELDLDLGTTSVRLYLVRQVFGEVMPGPITRYGDMWWPGTTRDGWGLVLTQQYGTIFSLLFTYRDDGRPTWFVMPQAFWSDPTTLQGNAFATKSSAWPLGYDANRLTSAQVGLFTLKFTAGKLTFDFTGPGRGDHVELSRLPF